jgi:hypothetical protein
MTPSKSLLRFSPSPAGSATRICLKSSNTALHASRALDESQVRNFAKHGKFEETAVALEMLCEFPIDAIERVFLSENPELILILAKSVGFSWHTTKYIMRLWPDSAYWSELKSEAYQSHFDKLHVATAKRIIRFYNVRRTASKMP